MTSKLWRVPVKRVSITLSIMVIIVFVSATLQAQPHNYVSIRKIENGKIYYEKYNFSEQEVVDISDLILWDKAAGDKVIFNTFYYDSEDLRLLLLKGGFAKLKDAANARPTEVEAQNSAAAQKRRIWQEGSTTPQPPEEKGGINWYEIFGYAWKGILLLASFGVITAVAQKAYKTLYLQRRVKLLILGEPSSGKSALKLSMIDPHISKKDLLDLEKSKALEKKIGLKHIPRGKFEIIPVVTDVPGSAFATAWDEMTENSNHVLLIVLSPYRANGVQADDHVGLLDVTRDIDQKYIDMQIAYVQCYIEGGLGSKAAKKPKLVVMFISKFDLFCKTKPGDSASKHIEQWITKIFSEHINSAKSAAKKAGVPFALLIGSAVEKWHTDEILNLTAKTLFKA